MIQKIVNFSVLKAPEGNRIAYTLYEIDNNGNIVRDNIKKSFVVLDDDLNNNIEAIETAIADRENI